MKKLFAIALLALLSITLFTACNKGKALTSESMNLTLNCPVDEEAWTCILEGDSEYQWFGISSNDYMGTVYITEIGEYDSAEAVLDEEIEFTTWLDDTTELIERGVRDENPFAAIHTPIGEDGEFTGAEIMTIRQVGNRYFVCGLLSNKIDIEKYREDYEAMCDSMR